MNSRIRTPFYIFSLNPDYVAAHSLCSLRTAINLTYVKFALPIFEG